MAIENELHKHSFEVTIKGPLSDGDLNENSSLDIVIIMVTVKNSKEFPNPD